MEADGGSAKCLSFDLYPHPQRRLGELPLESLPVMKPLGQLAIWDTVNVKRPG